MITSRRGIVGALAASGAVLASSQGARANPVALVVPCHRALRGDGSLGGYYWGLTRKRAMIAWEAGWARACGANEALGP